MPEDPTKTGEQTNTEDPGTGEGTKDPLDEKEGQEGQEGKEGKEGGEGSGEGEGDVDYKFPENFSDDLLPKEEVVELLKKHHASQEALDDLVPAIGKIVEMANKRSQEKWGEQVKKWAEESAAHKEFGGDKYDENIKTKIRPVIDKWGSPELVDILDKTGMAEHPAIMNFLFNIGKDVSKDGVLIFSDDKGSSGSGEKTMGERAKNMYPSMAKTE